MKKSRIIKLVSYFLFITMSFFSISLTTTALINDNDELKNELIITESINAFFEDGNDIKDDNTMCEGVLGSIDDNKDPAFWLFKAFRFIQILGPILVIIFSTIDFLSTIFSNNKEAMKNMFVKSLKRLACAVLLFFLPLIIKLLLQVFDIVSGTCGIG